MTSLDKFSNYGQNFSNNYGNIGTVLLSVGDISFGLTQLVDKITPISEDILNSIKDDQGTKINEGLTLCMDGTALLVKSLCDDFSEGFVKEAEEVKNRIDNLQSLITNYNKLSPMINKIKEDGSVECDTDGNPVQISNPALAHIESDMTAWGKSIDEHIEALAKAINSVKLGIDSDSMKIGGVIPALVPFTFNFTFDDSSYASYLNPENWKSNGDNVDYVSATDGNNVDYEPAADGDNGEQGESEDNVHKCLYCDNMIAEGEIVCASCSYSNEYLMDRAEEISDNLDTYAPKKDLKVSPAIYYDPDIRKYITDAFKFYRDVEVAYTMGYIDKSQYDILRGYISDKDNNSDKGDDSVIKRYYNGVDGNNRFLFFGGEGSDAWDCLHAMEDIVDRGRDYQTDINTAFSFVESDDKKREDFIRGQYTYEELMNMGINTSDSKNKNFYYLCAMEKARVDFLNGDINLDTYVRCAKDAEEKIPREWVLPSDFNLAEYTDGWKNYKKECDDEFLLNGYYIFDPDNTGKTTTAE